MNVKLIIADALQFFRRHIDQIATLCLPWLLAITVVQYLVIATAVPSASQEGNPLPLLGVAFHLLIYPIYTAAMILLMAKRAQRETPENRALLSSSIRIWQPLFILNIIIVGILLPCEIFIFQGWVFFAIPFAFVIVRLSFAEFYLVLEEVKPLDAIKMSFKATQPYFFQILLLLVIFALPLWSIKIVHSTYLNRPEISPLLHIISATAIAFLMLFVDVLMFRVYMSATRESQQ